MSYVPSKHWDSFNYSLLRPVQYSKSGSGSYNEYFWPLTIF